MAKPKKKDIEIEVEEASKVNPFAIPDAPPMQLEATEEEVRLADAELTKKYGKGEDLGLQPFPMPIQKEQEPTIKQLLGAEPIVGRTKEEMEHENSDPFEILESLHVDSIPLTSGVESRHAGSNNVIKPARGSCDEAFVEKVVTGTTRSESSDSPSQILLELEEERRKNELLRKAYQELAESKEMQLPANFWDGQPLQIIEPTSREVKWEGKNVRILFPCMKTTNPVTALCIGALLGEFGLEKIGMELRCGDSLIYHARNRLADQFVDSKSEWAFFIDDDVIPPIGRPSVMRSQIGLTVEEYPDKFLAKHVIKDLLRHGKKLIGGVYFGRRRHAPAMFSEAIDNQAAHQSAKRGEERLIATDWVATGCMLIHRDTFLAIREKFPDLAPAANRPYWDYFRPGTGFKGDTIGGEDEMFCYRAKQAGIQAYVDTSVQALHVGFMAYGATNTVYDRFDRPAGRPALVGGDPNKWW